MKPAICFLLFATAILSLSVSPDMDDLSLFLPSDGEIPPWKTQGDFQTAAGEDLYLLINGGAEIYLEYGFNTALFFQMAHPDGGGINVEIYEMTDGDAALGMFSLKKGTSSLSLPIGEACALDDYYLNLLKGHYLITLTGLNQEESTMAGLKKTAAWFDGKIKHSDPPPALYRKLAPLASKDTILTYIRGPLALNNRLSFPLFLFESPAAGVVFQQDGGQVTALMYENGVAASGVWEKLPEFARKCKNVTVEMEIDGSLRISTESSRAFLLEKMDRYILISDIPTSEAIGNLHRKIRKMLKDSFMV